MKIIKRYKDKLLYRFNKPLTDESFKVKCKIIICEHRVHTAYYKTVDVPKAIIDKESYYNTIYNVKSYILKRYKKSISVSLEDFVLNDEINKWFKATTEFNSIKILPRT